MNYSYEKILVERHVLEQAQLPGTISSSTFPRIEAEGYDFRNNIAYDTTRIREELAYAEPVSYEEGLRRTQQVGRTNPDD